MPDIEITTTGDTHLRTALELALCNASSAVGWCIKRHEDRPALFLYWSVSDGENVIPFPVKLGADELVPIASRWLNEQDYGQSPDTDGDVKKGFHVSGHSWNIDGPYCFARIETAWRVYGK